MLQIPRDFSPSISVEQIASLILTIRKMSKTQVTEIQDNRSAALVQEPLPADETQKLNKGCLIITGYFSGPDCSHLLNRRLLVPTVSSLALSSWFQSYSR